MNLLLGISRFGFSALVFGLATVAARADGWRLPRELKPASFSRAEVCRIARAEDAQKPFALVAVKSHACDLGDEQLCLKETYYLSDPCNRFVRERFATFHVRLELNSRRGWSTRSDWRPADRPGFVAEWGDVDSPRWLIIDPRACRVVATIDREALHSDAGKRWLGGYAPKARLLGGEYALQARAILAALPISLRARAGEADAAGTTRCLGQAPLPNLHQLWDELDRPRDPTSGESL